MWSVSDLIEAREDRDLAEPRENHDYYELAAATITKYHNLHGLK